MSTSNVSVGGTVGDRLNTEILVIGAGAAGLACAAAARRRGAQVTVISKAPPGRGCSTSVAGGIVNAALALAAPQDSPEAHAQDTVEAGRFLNEEPMVWAMTEGIVRELTALRDMGVHFVTQEGELVQVRSAGHRYPRTLVLEHNRGTDLSDPLRETAKRLGVGFVSGLSAVRILVHEGAAVGAAFQDPKSGQLLEVGAQAVVLATGGAGLFYQSTGIPRLVPGDGYALAYEAGCSLIDLEFVQFFPTSLVGEAFPNKLVPYDYLLSHGAVFRNTRGEDIVGKHNLPKPTMITRSQLSAVIGREVIEGNSLDGALFLDCRRFEPDFAHPFFRRHPFARFIQAARTEGRDFEHQPLRIAPIVHHYMGGIRVDALGETEVPGLLACGEAAGGTHGANRLAGNAFTEAVSSGFRVGEHAAALRTGATLPHRVPLARTAAGEVRELMANRGGTPVREVVDELRSILSKSAGACRNAVSLGNAREQLRNLVEAARTAAAGDLFERSILPTLPALIQVAGLLVESCLARAESRGAHVRIEFPGENDDFLCHLAHRAARPGITRLEVARSGLERGQGSRGHGDLAPPGETMDQE